MAEKNNSLEKALKVLDLFQTTNRLTLTEAVQETGYSVAAMSRILNTLEESNYIYQDKINNGYYLTNKLFVLGRQTNVERQIINVIDEPIGLLCRHSGFSVSVSIRSGVSSIIVLKKDPQNTLTLVHMGGDQISLNCTATGKVLTAFDKDPDKLMRQMDYVKLTSKTITNRKAFAEKIALVKNQGIAFDVEEVTEGLVCVAAPVLDAAGYAICAISISGYKSRMIKQMQNNITRLRDTAKECSELLK